MRKYDSAKHKASGKYKKTKSKLLDKHIVMWDGEGITTEGKHEYVMLCNSDGAILESKRHLTTEEIFNHLVENNDKDAINIGYATGYDINMWLLSASNARGVNMYDGGYLSGKDFIETILGNKTRYGVSFYMGSYLWRLSYRPRKEFTLSRIASILPDRSLSWFDVPATFRMWDVFGFYQSPFVKALQDNKIECELEETAEMKAMRGKFTFEDFDRIRAYCFSECRDGVALFKDTLKNCVAAEVIPSRFDGPGALATALYKSKKVKDHLVDEPEEVFLAVRGAYFGGRIEAAKLGRIDNMRGYDIASAYPAQIQNLPSLKGSWALIPDAPQAPAGPGIQRLLHLQYEYQNGLAFYPLPYRTQQNEVVFAAHGENWHWDAEYQASLIWSKRFDQPEARVLEYWEFKPVDAEARPFSFVPELYELRATWKNGSPKNPAEKILKLTLNSLYGKTAQQLGGSIEIDATGEKYIKKPPYFSMTWAGIITAGTRAELLKAACLAKDPANVVLFMTDGLYVREELEMETVKGALGKWEPPDTFKDFVIVQAGVYWYATEEGWKAHYRGFDKESMKSPDFVLEAWKQGKHELDVPVRRFMGFGIATKSDELWKRRCTWSEDTDSRKLQITGDCIKREGNLAILEGVPYVDLDVNINLDYLRVRRHGGYSMPYKPKLPTLDEELDRAKDEHDA
jgi:hypothetical protein